MYTVQHLDISWEGEIVKFIYMNMNIYEYEYEYIYIKPLSFFLAEIYISLPHEIH